VPVCIEFTLNCSWLWHSVRAGLWLRRSFNRKGRPEWPQYCLLRRGEQRYCFSVACNLSCFPVYWASFRTADINRI